MHINSEKTTKTIENYITNGNYDEAFDLIKPTSPKQMGLIMKEVNPKVRGKYDMGEVSKLIKDKLSTL